IHSFQEAAKQFLSAKAEALKTWRSPCQCPSPGNSEDCLQCPAYRALVRNLQSTLAGNSSDGIPSLLPPELSQADSEKVKNQCLKLYEYGYSLQDIKWITGLSNLKNIRKWLRETGLMGHSQQYSLKDMEHCVDLYKQGLVPWQIEEQTRIPADVVTQWLCDAGKSRSKRQYSDAEKKKCIDLYLQGKSAKTVASTFDIPERTVKQWIREAGAKRPRIFGGGRSPVFSQEFKEKCMELLRQGKTPTQVEKIMGVTADTIRRWRKLSQ
ncbi:MAG: helix-turn-helix domain-containing protein, partial [Leptolyngbyaceae bacterium]|nr:helix-turn-helix domain-containing protein [Leptolyngbyaceae bacterium]